MSPGSTLGFQLTNFISWKSLHIQTGFGISFQLYPDPKEITNELSRKNKKNKITTLLLSNIYIQ